MHHDHSRVSMVAADALAPIWRQGICNYHDDAGMSVGAYQSYPK